MTEFLISLMKGLPTQTRNRSTLKSKKLRANFRWVANVKFFLFRVEKLFALKVSGKHLCGIGIKKFPSQLNVVRGTKTATTYSPTCAVPSA